MNTPKHTLREQHRDTKPKRKTQGNYLGDELRNCETGAGRLSNYNTTTKLTELYAKHKRTKK